MKGVRFVLVAVLVCVAAVCSAQMPYAFIPEPDHPEFGRMSAVAKLHVGRTSGSGSLIAVMGDRALVLTCRHVCPVVGQNVAVKWPLSGQVSAGRVRYVEPGDGFSTDLALVVCDMPKGIKPLRVADYSQANGPFVAMGWRGEYFRLSVSRTSHQNMDGVIVTSGGLVGGMSGGPLFDGKGRIVGVCVGSDMRSFGLSVGECLEDLIDTHYR